MISMEPIKLTTPTLYSIFMQGGFTDDEIPETKASISKLNEALTKISSAYNLSYDDHCEIEDAFINHAVTSQYLGFLQGFNWAKQLLNETHSK